MQRAYFNATITEFLSCDPDHVLGVLTRAGDFSVDQTQVQAWLEQIRLLKASLAGLEGRGKVYFEYSIPRLGKRIDVVAAIDHVLFVLEFKVGDDSFGSAGMDQVCDYALDIKNFHEPSHHIVVAPILVATLAQPPSTTIVATTAKNDGLLSTMLAVPTTLRSVVNLVLDFCDAPVIDTDDWENGRYCPTPTIIEAALALYGGHDVADISRNDAGAINLSQTSMAVAEIIASAKADSRKAICFVTGVPGAGKTLVGLDVATKHFDKDNELYSVFLSGNGPLVAVLREALARDKVRREQIEGRKFRLGLARSEVKLFIQNVHNFRDDCLVDSERPPVEHVALFDEAQRAWNLEQTTKFMKNKKQRPDFDQSEPEFLISCLDRHNDWAVVVCLVGGGQEINTGEGGIGEWIDAITRSFPDWDIHISPRLHDSEFGAGSVLAKIESRPNSYLNDKLHLGVSMRSFRAENVSGVVKHLLDRDKRSVRSLLGDTLETFPIRLTRDLKCAKSWMRQQARGSERYGIVVSSQAQRLKPHAIDVRTPMDPVHWFLNPKQDIRSSYYLEDVATEFHVQGLELDWTCVVWDADFRHGQKGWEHFSFVGDRWNRILKSDRQTYLKNSYRVLLTRARQGMVVVVPEGDETDPTRLPEFYDSTYRYLESLGFPII